MQAHLFEFNQEADSILQVHAAEPSTALPKTSTVCEPPTQAVHPAVRVTLVSEKVSTGQRPPQFFVSYPLAAAPGPLASYIVPPGQTFGQVVFCSQVASVEVEATQVAPSEYVFTGHAVQTAFELAVLATEK